MRSNQDENQGTSDESENDQTEQTALTEDVAVPGDVVLTLMEQIPADSLSDEQRSRLKTILLEKGHFSDEIVRERLGMAFRGPLPPPSILQAYERVSPGLTETIVSQWTTETEHRRKMDTQVVAHIQATETQDAKTERQLAKWGQALGFTVAIVGFALAAFIAWLGHPGWAVAIGALDVVALVAVFVRSTKFRGQTETTDLSKKIDAEDQLSLPRESNNSDER